MLENQLRANEKRMDVEWPGSWSVSRHLAFACRWTIKPLVWCRVLLLSHDCFFFYCFCTVFFNLAYAIKSFLCFKVFGFIHRRISRMSIPFSRKIIFILTGTVQATHVYDLTYISTVLTLNYWIESFSLITFRSHLKEIKQMFSPNQCLLILLI